MKDQYTVSEKEDFIHYLFQSQLIVFFYGE